jgi:hypothetical protein
MPTPNLPLTSTVLIRGAQPADVRVTEVQPPNGSDDPVHVQLARGPVAVQIYGTLSELQLVVGRACLAAQPPPRRSHYVTVNAEVLP